MRILFQGDSITDAGRDRQDPHHLGGGYPKFAAERLQERFADRQIEFLNLGISGNRTCDLVGRWQSDCIVLQPDVVSIMIGVNDTWRAFDQNDPTTVEQYEANYRTILTQIREHTHAKILMLEPYLLDCDPNKVTWRADLDPKIHACRRLALEFADVFIPTDGLLAAASVEKEPLHWSGDGVHPNENGARLIGEWVADAMAKWIE
ncbi:MAG: SGNH/GDSL hydrolase family protein [Acutalibacteraceae bacterium]|jgi:acyl-CoA thioesterase-1